MVADVADLWALERAHAINARYHVLGGTLSPLDGIGPDDLTIDALVKRASDPAVKEVILALIATVDGQSTAHYITDLLHEARKRREGDAARPRRAGRRRTRLSRRGHAGRRDAQPDAVLGIGSAACKIASHRSQSRPKRAFRPVNPVAGIARGFDPPAGIGPRFA